MKCLIEGSEWKSSVWPVSREFIRSVSKEQTSTRMTYYKKFNLIKSIVQLDRFTKELLNQWWQLWNVQVFSTLFLLSKWREHHENLIAEDICLAKITDEEAEKELDEGAAIDIHGQGGRVDVAEVTTEDLGSESNATLDDDDVRVVITEAVTADQGGPDDVIRAAIETWG